MKPVFYILFLTVFFSCNFKQSEADLILHNGTIYTGLGDEKTYEAIAIKNGKIEALGTEREILNNFRYKKAIDLKKSFAYPGFIDAHSHFYGYSENMLRANLLDVQSEQELIGQLKEFAQKNPSLEWITGRGWDHTLWEEKNWPSRKKLDQAFPKKPVFVMRIDGHSALINTAGWKLLQKKHKLPISGAVFMKNKKGEFTGIVKEKALDLISEMIPDPNRQQMEKAFRRAEKKLFKAGLTTVCDAGLSKKQILLMHELYQAGKLSIPVYVMANPDSTTLNWLATKPELNKNIHLTSIKVYADGSLGSRSACLKQPYADRHAHHGIITTSKSKIRKIAAFALENDLQLNTHCIGDSAARMVMKVYGEFLGGTNDKRWRIEHAQVVTPQDIELFRKHTIIPSVQPTHATSDMRWAKDRLSEDRISHAYAYKTLKNALGLIALGTDFPVEDIDPLKTFYAAVFRQKPFTQEPENGFLPEQSLSPMETLQGMTSWAALSCRLDNMTGTLETEKQANLTILNKDILTLKQPAWDDVRVEMTVSKGKVVYNGN